MLPDLVLHVGNVIGDEGLKVVVDAALRPVTNLLTGVITRRFHFPPDSDGTEREEMRTEIERIKEAIASLDATIQHCAHAISWDHVAREAREPSTRRFVARAFDISANTTLESKRLLAGSLIARRLQATTDSDDEIFLRRALDTIEDLSENQLQILAAASLVQNPTVSWAPTIETPSRDEAEAALLPLLGIVRRFLNLDFGEDQFGALASVGAVRLLDDTGALLVHESTEPFDAWMQNHGVSPYDGIEGELGSSESHQIFRKRFPTISAITALGRSPNQDAMHHGRRLDGIIMTPLGSMIATLVLDQFIGSSETVLLGRS